MLVTMEHLLDKLAKEGGMIVCTSSLSQLAIAEARACGRMHVDSNSLGYVYLPPSIPKGGYLLIDDPKGSKGLNENSFQKFEDEGYEWNTRISEHSNLAPNVAVFDKHGNMITKVISYDTKTMEVVRYKTDANGKVIPSVECGLLTEVFISEGSYLAFRTRKPINLKSESLEINGKHIDIKPFTANLIPGIGQTVFYYPKGDEIEKYGGATVLPAICLCSGDMAPELSIFTKEASMPVVVKRTVMHVNEWNDTFKLADPNWVYGAKGYWSISDKETK